MKTLFAVLLLALALPTRSAQSFTEAEKLDLIGGEQTLSEIKKLGSNAWWQSEVVNGWHLLDNLTPGTFYDYNQHEWLAGGTSVIYKPHKLAFSFEGGITKPIERSDNAMPTFGLNYHLGSVLMQIEPLRDFINKIIPDEGKRGLLADFTFGGFIARDFGVASWRSRKSWRYGPYLGVEIPLGGK